MTLMRLCAAALALVLAQALCACTRVAPDATPEGAVRAWLEKMEASTQDPRATREAYELLGPAARANLAERAERAAKVQGRRVEPYEMLAEGRFGLKFRPKTMTSRIEPDGMHATVEVIGDAPQSEHAIVRCARLSADDPHADQSDKSAGTAETAKTRSGGSAKGASWRVEPELPLVLTLPKRSDAHDIASPSP